MGWGSRDAVKEILEGVRRSSLIAHGRNMADVAGRCCSGDYTESRELVISCLRLAEIEADIIEDIADACEVTGDSTAVLAGDDICVESVAQKLFLTEQEATTLIQVCRTELFKAGLNGKKGRPRSPFEPSCQDWAMCGNGRQGCGHTHAENLVIGGPACEQKGVVA